MVCIVSVLARIPRDQHESELQYFHFFFEIMVTVMSMTSVTPGFQLFLDMICDVCMMCVVSVLARHILRHQCEFNMVVILIVLTVIVAVGIRCELPGSARS